MGIFSDAAALYYEGGYNVLPLTKNGKQPVISGWQEWGNRRIPQYQLDAWIDTYADGNVGLPLGEVNGVIALDFDHDVDGLHQMIQGMIPPSPVRKVGAKGFTAFYRYNGERNKRWKKNGESVCELLSTGTQTVLPMSVHPDTGKPYVWMTTDTLFDYKPEELPLLPDDFIERVDEIFGIKRIIQKYNGTPEVIEIDTIKSALQVIPSSEYSVWIEIGMALHHTYGDNGFPAWDAWSATATNYDASKMQYKWRSFGNYNGSVITLATILHYAIGYGWFPPRLMNDDAVITVGEPASKIEPVIALKKLEGEFTLPDNVLNAPNLVGMLTEWINSTSIRHQPALSLGASIAAVGVLMAHRFRTQTDLRSNMLTLGICGAGLGKDHARKCIRVLFEEINMGDVLMGDFASDTAIISALYSRNGIGLAMTDEIGDALAAMNSKNAGSYEARIMRLTKEMFSSANTVYLGKEYANHDGKMEAKRINQPCLSMYGTSTQEQFYNALTSAKVLDGFLPRWLIFEGDGYAKKRSGTHGAITPPKTLIQAFRAVWDINPAGDNASLSVGVIRPRIVENSEGANMQFARLEEYAESRRMEEYTKRTGLDALFARIPEHAYKLALVAHEVGTGIINESVAAWACHTTMTLAERAIYLVKTHISDSEYERDMKKVLDFIAESSDGVSKSVLMRRFQRMPLADLNKMLYHLCESERVFVEERKGGNNRTQQIFTSA